MTTKTDHLFEKCCSLRSQYKMNEYKRDLFILVTAKQLNSVNCFN